MKNDSDSQSEKSMKKNNKKQQSKLQVNNSDCRIISDSNLETTTKTFQNNAKQLKHDPRKMKFNFNIKSRQVKPLNVTKWLKK